ATIDADETAMAHPAHFPEDRSGRGDRVEIQVIVKALMGQRAGLDRYGVGAVGEEEIPVFDAETDGFRGEPIDCEQDPLRARIDEEDAKTTPDLRERRGTGGQKPLHYLLS